MGCDFHWEGTASDEQQRLCGWFLESLFDADQNDISQYFSEHMKCQTYNGEYSGYCFEVGSREDRGPFLQTIRLVGTTIHPGHYVDSEPSCRLWATDQFSFVFLKTEDGFGELVTVEQIEDISQPRYTLVREKLENAMAKSDVPLFIFRRRGQDRLLANEGWLARLLYAVKRQFMPMLHVADDYGFFVGVAKRDELSEGFSYSILKPELADKWGVQFDSVGPIVSAIGTSFERNRIKNLGLSDASSALLSQAEVFSLSDLSYISRDSLERIYKPTPAILNEIDGAMRMQGYFFKADRRVSSVDEWSEENDGFDHLNDMDGNTGNGA